MLVLTAQQNGHFTCKFLTLGFLFVLIVLQFQVSDGAKTVPRLTPDQLATFVDYRKGGDGVRNMSASFDLRALQSAASKAIGSRCTGVTLIAEGAKSWAYLTSIPTDQDSKNIGGFNQVLSGYLNRTSEQAN